MYKYVDPIKSRSDFENVLKKNDGSLQKILQEFLKKSITRFTAEGIGSVCGRLSIGTAEKILESEIIDTTDTGTHLLELFYTLYIPTLIQWQCCHLLPIR
ncbi:hypothetical protein S245_030458 [Arachis hypogaea]